MKEAQPDERVVLREILRLGERTLAVQESARESILPRAGELLRLTIAALGGVIVVGGILAGVGLFPGRLPVLTAMAGFILMTVACVQFSVVLAGTGAGHHLASGPDFERVLNRFTQSGLGETEFLRSLASGLPGWVEENRVMIARIHRSTGYALLSLAAGTTILLLAFLYMLGGGISGR